jgi:copper chaperone
MNVADSHAVLNVPTVSCNHCKMAIENAVGAMAGVGGVAVDVAEKTVTIDFDGDAVSLEAIEETVTGVGYDVAGRHVFGA